MNQETFKKEIEKLGLNITEDQIKKLNEYASFLAYYNNITNLTTIVNKNDIYLKHFFDSISLYRIIDLTKYETLCDFGTGAGFPGVVLKIMFPNLKVCLVESNNKKVKFLTELKEKLNLQNIEVKNDRMEHFSKENVEKYQIIVARAVAKINVLLELCCQAVEVNGKFIAMKSSYEEELSLAEGAISKLGYEIDNIIQYKLPIENSDRSLISFKKNRQTDKKYPREYAKIIKLPL